MGRVVLLLLVVVAVLLGTSGHGPVAFGLVLLAGVLGLAPAVRALRRAYQAGREVPPTVDRPEDR